MALSKTARHTQQKLIDAFWESIEQEGIANLTVGKIAKKAGYNRTTFYEYFVDVDDLLHQEEEKLLQHIQKRIEANILQKDRTQIDFLELGKEAFLVDGEKLYSLISPKGDPAFSKRLEALLRPYFFELFQWDSQDPSLDYFSAYAFSALIGLMNCWIENDKNIAMDELFPLMHELIMEGAKNFIKSKVNQEK